MTPCASGAEHLVRFYDRNDQVQRTLVSFVAEGLARREYRLSHLHRDELRVQRVVDCHDRVVEAPLAAQADRVVLLADEFEDGRVLYQEYLEFKGYRVVTAADGTRGDRAGEGDQPAADPAGHPDAADVGYGGDARVEGRPAVQPRADRRLHRPRARCRTPDLPARRLRCGRRQALSAR